MFIFSHQRLLLPGLISFLLSLKKLPTCLLLPSEFPTSRRMEAGPLQEGPSQLLKALSNLRRRTDERVITDFGVWLGVYDRAGLKSCGFIPSLPSDGNTLCQVWCQAHTVGLRETQI